MKRCKSYVCSVVIIVSFYSGLPSDTNVVTPNTECSWDFTTKTRSTNDDGTSLDLEWEDEEGETSIFAYMKLLIESLAAKLKKKKADPSNIHVAFCLEVRSHRRTKSELSLPPREGLCFPAKIDSIFQWHCSKEEEEEEAE